VETIGPDKSGTGLGSNDYLGISASLVTDNIGGDYCLLLRYVSAVIPFKLQVSGAGVDTRGPRPLINGSEGKVGGKVVINKPIIPSYEPPAGLPSSHYSLVWKTRSAPFTTESNIFTLFLPCKCLVHLYKTERNSDPGKQDKGLEFVETGGFSFTKIWLGEKPVTF